MNINNINVNKYPVSQMFDPDSKVIFEIGYRNGLNLNDDVCDKNEWTVDIIKGREKKI